MNIKQINSQRKYQGKKLALDELSLEIDTKKVDIPVVRHPGAVVILPITNQGEILLIKQFRHPLEEFLLELPAGTLENGEDKLLCAKREIVEETGFSASTWSELGELVPAPGFCDEIQYCFIAKDLSPDFADKDLDEIIEPVSLSLSEIKKLISEFKIIDAKTIALIYRAELLGFLS